MSSSWSKTTATGSCDYYKSTHEGLWNLKHTLCSFARIHHAHNLVPAKVTNSSVLPCLLCAVRHSSLQVSVTHFPKALLTTDVGQIGVRDFALELFCSSRLWDEYDFGQSPSCMWRAGAHWAKSVQSFPRKFFKDQWFEAVCSCDLVNTSVKGWFYSFSSLAWCFNECIPAQLSTLMMITRYNGHTDMQIKKSCPNVLSLVCRNTVGESHG